MPGRSHFIAWTKLQEGNRKKNTGITVIRMQSVYYFVSNARQGFGKKTQRPLMFTQYL